MLGDDLTMKFRMFRQMQQRIGRDDLACNGSGQLKDLGIARKICNAEGWKSLLACAEQFPGASQFEIELSEGKAVVIGGEQLEALEFFIPDIRAWEQAHVARESTSANTASQLVELC